MKKTAEELFHIVDDICGMKLKSSDKLFLVAVMQKEYDLGVIDTLDEVTKDIKGVVDVEVPEFLKDDFVPTRVEHNGIKVI